jgi:hypothetical protein
MIVRKYPRACCKCYECKFIECEWKQYHTGVQLQRVYLTAKTGTAEEDNEDDAMQQ